MQPDREDKVFLFQGSNLVVPEGIPDTGITRSLTLNLVKSNFGPIVLDRIPALDGAGFISAALLDDSMVLPAGWKDVPLRASLHNMVNLDLRFSSGIQDILRAYHILQWERDTVFCGRCGGLCEESKRGISRICSSCGKIQFPRISPAIIVLITDEKDRILLAKNRNFKNHVYSLIAGFVEAGESLEETVIREVKEETHIDVDSIKYIISQPWPFPDSMMIGFRAAYAGGELKPDGEEIIDVQWFSRGTLPDIPGPGAISRFLIDQWHAEGGT